MTRHFVAPRSYLWAEELRALIRLGLPVAGTQFGFMLIGVVDTMMLGHVDALALAAGGLGNVWHWAWVSFGLGLVLGMEPLVSQGHGRGDREAIALTLQRGLLVVLIASLPICALQALTRPALLALGQATEVADAAHRYNLIRLPAVPGFLSFMALRVFLQGRGIVGPAFGVAMIANGFNAILDWALIFGHLGLPALGLEGAALASALTSLFMPAALAAWVRLRGLAQGYTRVWDRVSFSRRGLGQILRLGFPMGVQISVEAWAFSSAMFMAGWLGVVELASHQIVLNLAALSFMVPLGISIGAATRVGNAIGATDLAGARRAIWIAVAVAGSFACFTGTLFLLLRHQLPALFSDDADVVTLASSILPLVAGFQLFDASQAVGGGALRGMGRPNAGAVVNLLGFFVGGLPLGYYLAFSKHWGLQGLWTGSFLGLALVAGGVLSWAYRTSHRTLDELTVRAL